MLIMTINDLLTLKCTTSGGNGAKRDELKLHQHYQIIVQTYTYTYSICMYM